MKWGGKKWKVMWMRNKSSDKTNERMRDKLWVCLALRTGLKLGYKSHASDP